MITKIKNIMNFSDAFRQKVQNAIHFRPLPGALLSLEKCPFCETVDWLICLRGDLEIIRARQGALPVGFRLLTEKCLTTFWNIDLPAYEVPKDGRVSEDELVEAIKKSTSKTVEVIILGGCSKDAKPRQWAAFFVDEKKNPHRDSAAYCPLLWVDPLNLAVPQNISLPDETGASID